MSEKIRVLVNGAKGKMGAESVMAVNSAEDMILVKQTDIEDDLAESIKESNADVVVDFTAPSCVKENTETIIKSGVGGVIGTTGFTPETIDLFKKACTGRKPAVLIAPNFSISALLMMHCAKIAARYMPEVEIIELHHPGKKDAPSGTAIKTSELISEVIKSTVPRGTHNPGARGELFNGIPIHSVRLTGFLAHQEVIFGSLGQTLVIRQDSLNRTCFMPGVLMGIREVVKREGLIYGLDNILFES